MKTTTPAPPWKGGEQKTGKGSIHFALGPMCQIRIWSIDIVLVHAAASDQVLDHIAPFIRILELPFLGHLAQVGKGHGHLLLVMQQWILESLFLVIPFQSALGFQPGPEILGIFPPGLLLQGRQDVVVLLDLLQCLPGLQLLDGLGQDLEFSLGVLGVVVFG